MKNLRGLEISNNTEEGSCSEKLGVTSRTKGLLPELTGKSLFKMGGLLLMQKVTD